ncbi:sulfite exporter TauE/SafE family protein [Nonomuraea typhae]|uniref:sulfite exporter TauE/SafE family protein n=1 Tax=Nonomuraea typhae TaxID=2603600 RepID=UPI0012FB4A1F|nr:sulfite exporter TauE/SafE family protein [Nonomuraea typhae]
MHMLAVFAAGTVAGAVNAVVGSGTLITFPVLLASGLPPVTATISNALGLIPSSITGLIGYRKELAGQGRLVAKLGAGALAGGVTGAALLLALPAEAFERIVPALVGVALVLVACQPWLARRVRRRRGRPGPLLLTGLTLASVYGGYFAAAQGIVYMSLMGLTLDAGMQRLNAIKNVLVALVNTVAAGFFLVMADVDWTAVALLAAGSAIGGRIGAAVGRRLGPLALRVLILLVGTVSIVQLLLR